MEGNQLFQQMKKKFRKNLAKIKCLELGKEVGYLKCFLRRGLKQKEGDNQR